MAQAQQFKSPKVTKEQALRLYSGNQSALARALCITRSLVSSWDDGPIPELYALRIRFVLHPEAFKRRRKAA